MAFVVLCVAVGEQESEFVGRGISFHDSIFIYLHIGFHMLDVAESLYAHLPRFIEVYIARAGNNITYTCRMLEYIIIKRHTHTISFTARNSIKTEMKINNNDTKMS